MEKVLGQSESAHIKPGPKSKNFCSCSTQLSMKFILLINVKMLTIICIDINENIKPCVDYENVVNYSVIFLQIFGEYFVEFMQ